MENQTNQTTIVNQSLQATDTSPLIPPPPVQPIPEHPKENYVKILVIILIAALFGMGGLTIYFRQKTSNIPSAISESIPPIEPLSSPVEATPTIEALSSSVTDERITTKTNSYKDLIFQPPTDWGTYTENDSIYIQPIKATNEFDLDQPRVLFSSIDNSNNLTLSQLDEEAKKGEIYFDTYTTEGKPITVSGITGYYKKDKSCDPLACDMFVILYKFNIYQISFLFSPDPTSSQTNKQKQRAIFTQILSTFKLTDQTQSDISNWKTYTNKGLNISFNYPPDWSEVKAEVSGNITSIIALAPASGDIKAINYPPMVLYYYANPKKLSVPDFSKAYNASSEGMSTPFYALDSKKLVISGITEYYSEKAGCEPLLCDRLTFSYRDKIYVFDNIYEANVLPDQKALFDQIISTLKFTQ